VGGGDRVPDIICTDELGRHRWGDAALLDVNADQSW
jgi:hypothetical protein